MLLQVEQCAMFASRAKPRGHTVKCAGLPKWEFEVRSWRLDKKPAAARVAPHIYEGALNTHVAGPFRIPREKPPGSSTAALETDSKYLPNCRPLVQNLIFRPSHDERMMCEAEASFEGRARVRISDGDGQILSLQAMPTPNTSIEAVWRTARLFEVSTKVRILRN
jgi:hypothetical protein